MYMYIYITIYRDTSYHICLYVAHRSSMPSMPSAYLALGSEVDPNLRALAEGSGFGQLKTVLCAIIGYYRLPTIPNWCCRISQPSTASMLSKVIRIKLGTLKNANGGFLK